MDKGLIGISTSKSSWISKLIRYFRKSYNPDPPTHVFVVVGEFNGKKLIIESTNPIIRLNFIDSFLDENKKLELWEIIHISNEKINSSIDFLLTLLNKSYGYFQLIGFFFVWIGCKLRIKINNPFTKNVICSELVYIYLKSIGYVDEYLDNLGQNNIAPDDILKSFVNSNKAVKIFSKDFGGKKE